MDTRRAICNTVKITSENGQMPPLLMFRTTSLEGTKALPPMCLHTCYSEVLLYFVFSGVRLLLNSCTCIPTNPKAQKTQNQKKKTGVSMALNMATLPLILYREHVLHCEKIIHIPTLFRYFLQCHSYSNFQCFFYLYIIKIDTYMILTYIATSAVQSIAVSNVWCIVYFLCRLGEQH